MPPKNPNRIARVNALIQETLGPVLQQQLEDLPSLVTISRVETTGDMRWAKVWISVLGEDDDKVMDRLKRHMYDIQGEVNRSFTTKIVPRIQFLLDTTPRYAQHIEELIHKIHEDDGSGK
jgi:ribosome-binding factor A